MVQNINMVAVKKIRKLFRSKTDKEAVNTALRLVADEGLIIAAHKHCGGKIKLNPVYR